MSLKQDSQSLVKDLPRGVLVSGVTVLYHNFDLQPLPAREEDAAAVNPLYANMPPSSSNAAVSPYPSAPSRQGSPYPASVHPDYAGGRTFNQEMFTTGRYDMPEVYKRGMSVNNGHIQSEL